MPDRMHYDGETSLSPAEPRQRPGRRAGLLEQLAKLWGPFSCGEIPHKGSVPLDRDRSDPRTLPWGGRQWGAATKERGGNAPLYHIPYSSPPLQENPMGRPHRRVCRQCNTRATSRRMYVGWPHPPLFTTVTVDLCGPCWRSYTDIMCTLGPATVKAQPAWVHSELTADNG